MANKVGMNFGANTGLKELKIGKTFNKGCKDESYHTIRYDFKPASVDAQKVGTLEVVDKEVTLTVPTEGGGLTQAAVFKGNKTPASKDCLLIIDHETGEVVLERISQHIRVKKTRAEGSSKKILPRGPFKSSPSQNHSTSSPHVPRPSPSHTGRSPPSKSPSHPPQKNGAPNKPQNSSGSMPLLNFEEENKHNSIMSDSSSDSDSNSVSSSSSDSDSDSEPETAPPVKANGAHSVPTKNHNSPSILSDLELSEED